MWQKIKDFLYLYSPFVVWLWYWDEENNEEYLTRISRLSYIRGLIYCPDWLKEHTEIVPRYAIFKNEGE